MFTYTHRVHAEGGSGDLRFMLPTAIAPRYGPVHHDDAAAVAAAGAGCGVATHSATAVHFNCAVRVKLGTRVTSITSPSHEVSVATSDDDPTVATVTMIGEEPMTHDMVLVMKQEDPYAPAVFTGPPTPTTAATGHLAKPMPTSSGLSAEPPGEADVLLSLLPRMELGATPTEVIFLVDR